MTLSHAENLILLPPEILNTLQEEYAAQPSIKPILHSVKVTIQREQKSQTINLNKDQDILDLANYIPNTTESFILSFETSFPLDAQTKLFFINRYQSVDKKGHKEGMACGKAIKIQTQLNKLFTTQGVKFMTRDASYLSLLGGDFLLTRLEKEELQVIYFKVVDGRYSVRLCR